MSECMSGQIFIGVRWQNSHSFCECFMLSEAVRCLDSWRLCRNSEKCVVEGMKRSDMASFAILLWAIYLMTPDRQTQYLNPSCACAHRVKQNKSILYFIELK